MNRVVWLGLLLKGASLLLAAEPTPNERILSDAPFEKVALMLDVRNPRLDDEKVAAANTLTDGALLDAKSLSYLFRQVQLYPMIPFDGYPPKVEESPVADFIGTIILYNGQGRRYFFELGTLDSMSVSCYDYPQGGGGRNLIWRQHVLWGDCERIIMTLCDRVHRARAASGE